MKKFLMIQLQVAPYAGVAYLNGAVTSSGHQFILFLGNNIKKILRTISQENPDLIGFTCMTMFYPEIIKMVCEIKKNFKTLIIIGGPHPTFSPELIHEPGIDMICRGEGEFPLIELLNALDQSESFLNIKNLWVKDKEKIYRNELRPLIAPLDELPMIDWSCYRGTIALDSPPVAFPIRGCPYACTYCFNDAMRNLYGVSNSQYVRYFSINRAVQEIKIALKYFNPRAASAVVFNSDTFGIDLDWMEDFFESYGREIGLPFIVFLRPELVTERCVKILAKFKCHSVAIGVESGSERIRKEILGRNYSNKTLLEAASRLHHYKIKFRTYNMLGLPTETESEMWETIDINIKMKANYPKATIFVPLPQTKLVEFSKEKEYLAQDFSFSSVSTMFSTSVLEKINTNKVNNMLYFFQTAILFPKSKRLINGLIRLKSNFLFRWWFYFIYVNLFRRLEKRSWIPYVRYILANRYYK